MSTFTAASLTPAAFVSVANDGLRPDATLLRLHMARCASANGRWFSVRCIAESVHRFLAPRFATTLALMLAVVMSVAMAA